MRNVYPFRVRAPRQGFAVSHARPLPALAWTVPDVEARTDELAEKVVARFPLA